MGELFGVGYVRVSTQDQAEEGMSLEAQRAKIVAYAELHGIKLLEIYEDAGLSGKRADNRPGLQKALAAACKKKAIVIVYSLSRLARSTRDAIDISSRLEKAGANLASISEKLDTTSSMGRFFFTLMAALAQLERDQISERTTATLGHMRKCGLRISGNIPFGYRLDGDNKKLIEVLEEQAILKWIKECRAAGESLGAIARSLNERGIKSKTGKLWQRCSIFSVLKRPAAAVAAAVLLGCLIVAGCAVSRSSEFDRSIIAGNDGVAGVVAHTESAERHVQSAIPHADPSGKQWLAAASEEHKQTIKNAGQISDALTTSQKLFNLVNNELQTLKGKWYVRWGQRIERLLWIAGISWLVLGIGSVVLRLGNPLGWAATIGEQLGHLLPVSNPFNWAQKRIASKRSRGS